jgi:hypothetical protein
MIANAAPPALVGRQPRPRGRHARPLDDVDGPDIAVWALYPSRQLLSERARVRLARLPEDGVSERAPDELAA